MYALADISQKLEVADANTVYKITGCLSSCEKFDYNKIDGKGKATRKPPHDILLEIIISNPSYQEMEQYVLYDSESFIADVGGFMGLLLGYSALSIYNELVNILDRYKFGCMPKRCINLLPTCK